MTPFYVSYKTTMASGRVVNMGLATEVVTFCDALCMSWRAACDARERLRKVKAQSYIDKFESKLADACVECEEALDGVKACLLVVATRTSCMSHKGSQV